MAEKVIGTLKDYITLDEAAMALARMRMHRTVRNASKEFLLRFLDVGWSSTNKCLAREFLPPRRQWGRLVRLVAIRFFCAGAGLTEQSNGECC